MRWVTVQLTVGVKVQGQLGLQLRHTHIGWYPQLQHQRALHNTCRHR